MERTRKLNEIEDDVSHVLKLDLPIHEKQRIIARLCNEYMEEYLAATNKEEGGEPNPITPENYLYLDQEPIKLTPEDLAADCLQRGLITLSDVVRIKTAKDETEQRWVLIHALIDNQKRNHGDDPGPKGEPGVAGIPPSFFQKLKNWWKTVWK